MGWPASAQKRTHPQRLVRFLRREPALLYERPERRVVQVVDVRFERGAARGQTRTESANGEAWTTIGLTICLPPREVVPHCARRRVQHDARVERGRVAQRLVREVRGPVHHVCGGEERRERREDLGVAPVIQDRGFAQEEAARAKAQMGAMSRVRCEEAGAHRKERREATDLYSSDSPNASTTSGYSSMTALAARSIRRSARSSFGFSKPCSAENLKTSDPRVGMVSCSSRQGMDRGGGRPGACRDGCGGRTCERSARRLA